MRKARIETVRPDFPHHVILRGNNKRRLFSYPRDYEFFLYVVARALQKVSVELHSIVLMSNHVHAVITPSTVASLARWVQSVSQRYAQRRNHLRGATGKLFEERYRADPIETSELVGVTLAYGDLNPLRAGIVVHPSEYRWSSYGHYAGVGTSAIPRSLLTPPGWYLSLASTDEHRCAAYAAWVDHCHAQQLRRDAAEREFVRRMAAITPEAPGPREDRRPNRTRAI